MSRVNIIVAYNHERVIGRDNQIPWHIPEDLQYFKRVTMGCPIIMGRKTHESIGKQLPGRLNIILTKNFMYQPYGLDTCVYCDHYEALRRAKQENKDIFIIGGASVYKQYLDVVDKVYVTLVKNNLQGDTFFPTLSKQEWSETNIIQSKDYDRIVYIRKAK